MKTYDEKQEKIGSIYLKVLKKFPEIKKGDIKLKYLPYWNNPAGIMMMNYPVYKLSGDIIKEPAIYIGNSFSKLNDKEKEVVIAHELGHYMRERKYGIEVIRRNLEWTIKFNTEEHITKRLEKWSLMREFYADNFAVKAGYGNYLVTLLKKIIKYPFTDLKEEEQKIARIENLEKILREENFKN